MPRPFPTARYPRLMIAASVLVVGGVVATAQADYSTPARTVSFEGETVRYHVMGEPDAPVAILLGGGPGFSSWNLEPVQRRLAAIGYRVVLMDMLGVGENERDTLKAPLAAWERQIEQVHAEVADDERVLLVGHSWGALMALVYTQSRPAAVERIVMLNPVDPERRGLSDLVVEIDNRRAAAIGDDDWPSESDWDNRIGTAGDMGVHARRQIGAALPSYFLDYRQGQRYARQFSERDFDPDLNVRGWSAYRDNPVGYATIRRWDVPIDFIGCRQDLLMPENLEALQANLSLARIEVLTGCVHFPWEEVPQQFGEALARVVARPAPGEGSDGP
ncbi:alpha/beta hydrolase [Guyparkeria hydrothermalis]|uniref:alpha/beta fold hydrolase n=1 Tax=Guyparkeria hydrothermalis TaxID=923 RepID=UPI0020208336|nr:alpha/beta hydrolase [Guyparkeria hydrothermalis]MCL7743348.1 alpha/beta hydrolase [Guyparkeria hydrothermalis]